jgi:hypothetical protein
MQTEHFVQIVQTVTCIFQINPPTYILVSKQPDIFKWFSHIIEYVWFAYFTPKWLVCTSYAPKIIILTSWSADTLFHLIFQNFENFIYLTVVM